MLGRQFVRAGSTDGRGREVVVGEHADPSSERLGRGARLQGVELPVGHSRLTPWGQVLPGEKVTSYLDRRGSFEMFLENFFEVRFF